MRVLVTAGGTTEQIDDVRGITNFSTGRLGSLIASYYSKDPTVKITYICGKNAVQPIAATTIEIIEIGSTQELLTAVTNCLKKETYDVVVHSMAVSDYYLVGSSGEKELLTHLTETAEQSGESLKNGLDQAFLARNQTEKKLSSQIETLYLQLKQTPKVIALIKQLQPETCLVGFKLLVAVPQAELIAVAERLMTSNHCDFVLANDKSQITADQHIGYLVDSMGKYTKYQTKDAIAQGIVEQTTRGRITK